MTRFVLDASAALRRASQGLEPATDHELLAPTLWRSQVLLGLHEAAHGGEIFENVDRARLAHLGQLKIRLLGDVALPTMAWQAANGLGSASIYDLEEIAPTRLQADALVTLDRGLTRAAEKVVKVAPSGCSSSLDPLAAVSVAAPSPIADRLRMPRVGATPTRTSERCGLQVRHLADRVRRSPLRSRSSGGQT